MQGMIRSKSAVSILISFGCMQLVVLSTAEVVSSATTLSGILHSAVEAVCTRVGIGGCHSVGNDSDGLSINLK